MTGSAGRSGQFPGTVTEPYMVAASVPPEPDGRIGFLDASGDVWARHRDGWWPALDQAGYGITSYPSEARPFAHPWSWPAMVAEHGPGKVFPLPDPIDTGSLPAQSPGDG